MPRWHLRHLHPRCTCLGSSKCHVSAFWNPKCFNRLWIVLTDASGMTVHIINSETSCLHPGSFQPIRVWHVSHVSATSSFSSLRFFNYIYIWFISLIPIFLESFFFMRLLKPSAFIHKSVCVLARSLLHLNQTKVVNHHHHLPNHLIWDNQNVL